ncbi:coil containing protein [Vibrio phage 1.186.O._10N.286.49.E3]|nr:coil containing protein [Vibrio phage 1.186.O._10N.286.49.E3]AUS00331.1 coil containing protein [Vibrio phage 1.273.O._10N.286.54.C7]
MSDLDNAINSINASAAKAENTATFLDDMSTFDDQSSVTNPNNGQTVASIPKQVKDRTDELFTAAESDINQAVSDAEQSATDAQDAADSIGRYQGLWPDTGGSADKGDTYQTQVGGTPTGQYFTALQNTIADPVGDDVNWRGVVSVESINTYCDISYKSADGLSSIENMVTGNPLTAKVGDICGTKGMQWERVSVSSPDSLDDFRPLTPVTPSSWGLNEVGFNNADAIQSALEYCHDNNTSFIGPNVEVETDKTIFLPNFPSFDNYQVIDFGGMVIRPDDTVFKPMQSGKRVGGVWESAMSDPLQTNMTFNTKLTGLVFVRDDPETKDGRVALEIKDWHQSCELETLIARNFQTALDSYNNFYLNYGNLKLQNAALASGERTGIGFIFRTAVNLNNIKQLVSQNVDTGYVVDGLVTALHIETISLEGQNHGLITTGEVRGMTVSGTYGEYNVTDSEEFFDFQGPVYNVAIDGCYFTSSNANTWIIKSISSPRSAIMFGKNNNLAGTLDETRVFENKGYGYRTLGSPSESQGSDIDGILMRESDLGVGTVVDKYAVDVYVGDATYSVAMVHNEIIPANYSGRMTRGFNSNRQPGLYGFTFDQVAGEAKLSTRILYSSTQYIRAAIRVNDFASTKEFFFEIHGDNVYNIDRTVSPDVSFSTAADGTIELTISGLSTGGGATLSGGEIRVI